MTKTESHKAAKKSFDSNMTLISTRMQSIIDKMTAMEQRANETSTLGVNWAHAGTAAHVAQLLKEIEEGLS